MEFYSNWNIIELNQLKKEISQSPRLTLRMTPHPHPRSLAKIFDT
jgi:hypothetical protein